MKIKSANCVKGLPALHKLIASLAVLICIGTASCKKEALPNSSTISASEASNLSTDTETLFGAQVGETLMDDNLTVLNLLGVKYVRVQIVLKDFTGPSSRIDSYIDDGYKILLNINYGDVQNKNGTKKPVPFPTDMVEYTLLLKKVLDVYHPEVAVIENEPTTNQFHSGPIEDYITELTTATTICKQYGVKVADGSVNVQRVQQVMNGQDHGWADALEETKKLIDAYKIIPLDYVNVHTSAPFNSRDNPNVYPPGVLEDVADYLRTTTGKQVMCNEYNQDNQSTGLMTTAVNGFKAGGYKYMIARSNKGGAGNAEPLNKGTKLTAIGIAFRDAIK